MKKFIFLFFILFCLNNMNVQSQWNDDVYQVNVTTTTFTTTYQSPDYDFFYTSRIRRFYRYVPINFSYYSPYFTDTYWYDPILPGLNIYISFNQYPLWNNYNYNYWNNPYNYNWGWSNYYGNYTWYNNYWYLNSWNNWDYNHGYHWNNWNWFRTNQNTWDENTYWGPRRPTNTNQTVTTNPPINRQSPTTNPITPKPIVREIPSHNNYNPTRTNPDRVVPNYPPTRNNYPNTPIETHRVDNQPTRNNYPTRANQTPIVRNQPLQRNNYPSNQTTTRNNINTQQRNLPPPTKGQNTRN